MKRLGSACAVLLTLLMLGALAAPASNAVTAPFWAIGGTRLEAGRTHNILGKAGTTFTIALRSQGIEVSCPKFTLNQGVLLGSEAGEPGAGGEVIVFSDCTVHGNGPGCQVEGDTITTDPLKSKLVEDGATGKQLLTEFSAASGTAFMNMKFTGSECIDPALPASGQVAAEVRTDDTEEAIELGQPAKEAHLWRLKFPELAIHEITLVKAGKADKSSVELMVASITTTILGTALVLLAGPHFESEVGGALWSPLP